MKQVDRKRGLALMLVLVLGGLTVFALAAATRASSPDVARRRATGKRR